jgi:hypothetical protein
VIKYVDSRTHELRYTLKNKSTEEIYAVVLFTLLFGDELEEVKKELGDGNVPAKSDDSVPDSPPDDDDLD